MKDFIKVLTLTCPYCNTRQTVFVQQFVDEGNLGLDSIGFQCAVYSCRKFVTGAEFFETSHLSVGDLK